ncbi:MAG: YARHG domain-containing protein [Dysgonomonas sp.]|nr:YARHG domain-containing protein [Dysgonomonas sp.]
MKYILYLLFLPLSLLADNGTFYMSGSHLVPATETDISLNKEVLAIKRINNNQVKVTVYYEFFNPSNAKMLTVGFEAPSPIRGQNGVSPSKDHHPYIADFSIEMNNYRLSHKITLTPDGLPFKNSRANSLTDDEAFALEKKRSGFNYLYYINANFQKGLNKVMHTYTFQLSKDIHHYYAFKYNMSSAMQWANKQIDDFTLAIDMGEYQDFFIPNVSFSSSVKPNLIGVGRIIDKTTIIIGSDDYSGYNDRTRFIIKNGHIEYNISSFHPKEELFVYSPCFQPANKESFDYRKQATLPFSNQANTLYEFYSNPISRQIIWTLPFARRGYISTTPIVQDYFSRQVWYIADPDYRCRMETLTIEEQEMVEYFAR